MRIAIALYILSFLILLSILESLFSFVFSLALQKTVVFPLVQWFFLVAEWVVDFFLFCVEGFMLFIATAFDVQTYGPQLVALLGVLTAHFTEFPSILFYPLILIFGDVLASLPAELIAEGVEEAAAVQPVGTQITSGLSAIVTAIIVTIGSSGGEEKTDTTTEFKRG